jgi:hypothetical protein
MKLRLTLLFSLILAGMLFVTTRALRVRSVFDNAYLISDPWGIATLADAYAGFMTFFAWVAYKERTGVARAVWFVLIMTLGNIAMSIYVLATLMRLGPKATAKDLLLRSDR